MRLVAKLVHFFYFQMFGFLLYVSGYAAKGNGSVLSVPKVWPSLPII